MAATPPPIPEEPPLRDAAALLTAALALPDTIITVGSGAAIAELMGRPPTVRDDGGWLALESEPWHLHLNLRALAVARFEMAPSAEAAGGTSYSLALLDHDGRTACTVYFTGMAEADGTPRPDRVAAFTALQARAGGAEVRFAPAP
jgi:putative heme degradation protein